ncbi:MAG: DUF167 domain-containing protein [Alphaproteobacteria bacterium]|nr:DUF167 domain-containing protein [Alphaproteobacteria bacterium]
MPSFHVRLTPHAAHNAVIGWVQDETGMAYLKVCVTAVPEKGKANETLIKLLAKEWGIPKSAFSILRGETDRHKVLSVDHEGVLAFLVPP